MKNSLFAIAVLALLVAYIFGDSAMANETLENLTGTWLEGEPEGDSFGFPFRDIGSPPAPCTITIEGDKITLTRRNEVLYSTIFRLDGNELKNTKKRENWQAYVEMHQHEQFGHFERIELLDGVLIGFLFIADMGYVRIPFVKHP